MQRFATEPRFGLVDLAAVCDMTRQKALREHGSEHPGKVDQPPKLEFQDLSNPAQASAGHLMFRIRRIAKIHPIRSRN